MKLEWKTLEHELKNSNNFQIIFMNAIYKSQALCLQSKDFKYKKHNSQDIRIVGVKLNKFRKRTYNICHHHFNQIVEELKCLKRRVRPLLLGNIQNSPHSLSKVLIQDS